MPQKCPAPGSISDKRIAASRRRRPPAAASASLEFITPIASLAPPDVRAYTFARSNASRQLAGRHRPIFTDTPARPSIALRCSSIDDCREWYAWRFSARLSGRRATRLTPGAPTRCLSPRRP
jgi:hypothetical protein